MCVQHIKPRLGAHIGVLLALLQLLSVPVVVLVSLLTQAHSKASILLLKGSEVQCAACMYDPQSHVIKIL